MCRWMAEGGAACLESDGIETIQGYGYNVESRMHAIMLLESSHGHFLLSIGSWHVELARRSNECQ